MRTPTKHIKWAQVSTWKKRKVCEVFQEKIFNLWMQRRDSIKTLQWWREEVMRLPRPRPRPTIYSSKTCPQFLSLAKILTFKLRISHNLSLMVDQQISRDKVAVAMLLLKTPLWWVSRPNIMKARQPIQTPKLITRTHPRRTVIQDRKILGHILKYKANKYWRRVVLSGLKEIELMRIDNFL